MEAVVAIIFAGLVGFIGTFALKQPIYAWFLGCLVMPAFMFLAEFVLPYQGGGASMWPIALVFGSVYGAISSVFGVCLATRIRKAKRRNT